MPCKYIPVMSLKLLAQASQPCCCAPAQLEMHCAVTPAAASGLWRAAVQRPLGRTVTASFRAPMRDIQLVNGATASTGIHQLSPTKTLVNGSTAVAEQMKVDHLSLVKPVMIITDLDDTLIGEGHERDQATLAFTRVWNRTGPLNGAVAGGHASADALPKRRLVVNTGRSLPMYEDVAKLKQGILPHVDVLVCGVGTRIFHRDENGHWALDGEWESHLNVQTWSLTDVAAIVSNLQAYYGGERIELAAASEQSAHKLTVKIDAEIAVHVRDELESALKDKGIEFLLVTGWTNPRTHCVIDILPSRAGKGNAAAYVHEKYGWSASQVVACGDAYNDVTMLSDGRWNSVVVGNAVQELRTWAETALSSGLRPAAESLLTNGNEVNKGSKGALFLASRPTAYGILEGLQRMGFVGTVQAEGNTAVSAE